MLDYDISEFEKIKVEKNTDNEGLTGIKPNKGYHHILCNNYHLLYPQKILAYKLYHPALHP